MNMAVDYVNSVRVSALGFFTGPRAGCHASLIEDEILQVVTSQSRILRRFLADALGASVSNAGADAKKLVRWYHKRGLPAQDYRFAVTIERPGCSRTFSFGELPLGLPHSLMLQGCEIDALVAEVEGTGEHTAARGPCLYMDNAEIESMNATAIDTDSSMPLILVEPEMLADELVQQVIDRCRQVSRQIVMITSFHPTVKGEVTDDK
jgi:hypothetical protein